MNVAIFGGSFNPVHNEHINIVMAAIEALSLDRVIIMPTAVTPAKTFRTFAPAADRLQMCRTAFSDIDKVVVSDYEISKEGTSYSYLTCNTFKEKYPRDKRYFIVGGDALENFDKWKNPDKILGCVTLAVCAREDEARLDSAINNFTERFGREVRRINYVGSGVSSTKIRVLAALGESLKGLVSHDVERYVRDNALYAVDGAEKVKKLMSPHRWAHTVGVAVMAAENCPRYGVNERTAVTAALFHDCGKEISPDNPLVSGFAFPRDVPSPVIHQYTGAYLAENAFGIKDKNVLNAVKYHCSGREDMSPIEKLIFLSDMLEEGRDYDGVANLRELFFKDKDAAFFAALDRQLTHLRSSDKPVYFLTQKAYEYAKEHKNDK